MSEGGTHRNGVGHVVPAMVASWLPPRDSDLWGTTPGSVRDRVAPHRSTRKSTPTVRADHADEGVASAGTK